MGKCILVTGSAGFIGFHVAVALKKRGDEVVALDNFNSYYAPALKRRRSELLQELGIEVIKADVNDRAVLEGLFRSHPFTDLLHLAAQAGVRYAQENGQAYIDSNIQGFFSVLEQLRLYPHVKLTYASSSSVYGCNSKIPFSVSDATDKPANLYAATKKANELMAYSYHHIYGLRTCGLRFFTVYGPWGRPDMAYFSFTKAIVEDLPITIYNGGEMERDFTYIDDVVAGTIAALDHPGECELFNIGNNRPTPLMDFVSILESLLNKRAIKLFSPSAGEVKTTFADISTSSEQLGFTPKTSLQIGLHHFVDWYLSIGKELVKCSS